MKLVIVESPTKAKTISRFLGKEYTIKASMGHVMDLPKSKLGIDVENNFTPQYEMVEDRKTILNELKRLAKSADSIILATDPDREGEAIAAHIKEALSSSEKRKTKSVKFSRIVFHEITKSAIEEATQHPRELDEHLVSAQTARRVLDRLVGYKLSPVLWRKIRKGLSAGRVQSVALRLIVEREREIQKFQKEPYWTIGVLLLKGAKGTGETDGTKGKKTGTEFELVEVNGKKIELSRTFTLYDGEYTVSKTTIITQEQADAIFAELKTMEYIVADVVKKKMKRSPQPPYTTSTLQQDASRRLGFPGKRTMSIAQKLYEEGFITYHRTDSVHMSASAVSAIQTFVKAEYGQQYVASYMRTFKAKQKLAQEAHECIRVTEVGRRMSDVQTRLGLQFAKLYDLIWRRAVASQMSEAEIESTTVYADAMEAQSEKRKAKSENRYRFKTTGSVLVFDGFLKVNPFGLQDRQLPEFSVQELLTLKDINAEQHETPPPPRYNDASLVSSLEEEGIGRPSTYASIIGTIETRQYIEREQGRFIPTAVGTAVNDFLVEHFSTIDDIPFTAKIEDELDQVAKGEKAWVPMIKDFYTPLEEKLKTVGEASRVKIAAEEIDEKCPKDGGQLVIRVGKFGKFISCNNFPACDFKKAFVQDTNILCPKDGANAEKPGKVIMKKTKKGRTFYGCSNYPNCDFAVWKLKDIGKKT